MPALCVPLENIFHSHAESMSYHSTLPITWGFYSDFIPDALNLFDLHDCEGRSMFPSQALASSGRGHLLAVTWPSLLV